MTEPPLRSRSNVAVAYSPTAVGWICTVGLVLAFEFHAPAAEVWLLGLPVLACLFLLELTDPARAISLLAAPLVLGPIARISLPGGLILHLGDLGIGVMVVAIVLRRGGRTPLSLGRYQLPILTTMALVLIGWLLGMDLVASTPSMVAMLEMVAIYVLTMEAIEMTGDVDDVILGWITAISLGAALVIIGYLRLEPLGAGGIEAHDRAASVAVSTTFLYRATFFVTGFGYPLASTVLCALMWLVAGKGSMRLRLLLGAGLLIDLLAVGLMGGATVGGAIAIGVVGLAFWTAWLPGGSKRLLWLGLTAAVAAIVMGGVLSQVMTPAQLDLLLSRTHSAGTLYERFKVWRNVVEFLLTNPHTMLIGLGPDISTRLGDQPLLRQLFNGQGVQQNAVDSGYLYLLLNYGVFVTLLVIGLALHMLGRLTRVIYRQASVTSIALWLSILAWLIMAATQQGGLSKPMFITAQFVALASALYDTSRRSLSPSP